MNSLEKLIDQLEACKGIVNNELKGFEGMEQPEDGDNPTIYQWNYVISGLQAAINRLKILNEELAVEE